LGERGENMRIYFNTDVFGWIMFGIGWKAKWFLGLSIAKKV